MDIFCEYVDVPTASNGWEASSCTLGTRGSSADAGPESSGSGPRSLWGRR